MPSGLNSSAREAEVDLTLDNVLTPEGLFTLGTTIAEMLAAAGSATVVIGPNRGIKLIAPTQVLVLEHDDLVPPGMVPVLGRQVVTSGRPEIVRVVDGKLYEIEFEEESTEGEEHHE